MAIDAGDVFVGGLVPGLVVGLHDVARIRRRRVACEYSAKASGADDEEEAGEEKHTPLGEFPFEVFAGAAADAEELLPAGDAGSGRFGGHMILRAARTIRVTMAIPMAMAKMPRETGEAVVPRGAGL